PLGRDRPVGAAPPGRSAPRTRVGPGARSPVDRWERDAQESPLMISRMRSAVSVGVLPTLTPAASRASFFACAVPAEPETIEPAAGGPAWPGAAPPGPGAPAT